VRKFQEEIEELGLGPEQVYKADEGFLFGRLLTTKLSSTMLKIVQPAPNVQTPN
jgi:hypothetical protein